MSPVPAARTPRHRRANARGVLIVPLKPDAPCCDRVVQVEYLLPRHFIDSVSLPLFLRPLSVVARQSGYGSGDCRKVREAFHRDQLKRWERACRQPIRAETWPI